METQDTNTGAVADIPEASVPEVLDAQVPVQYDDPEVLAFMNDEVSDAFDVGELPRVTFTAEQQSLVMRFTGGETENIPGAFGCIIWGSSKKRSLHTEAFDPDSPAGPVCASPNGATGIITLREGQPIPFFTPDGEHIAYDGTNEPPRKNGEPLQTAEPPCVSCPYNKWGSISTFGLQRPNSAARGKACTEFRQVLVTPLLWMDDTNEWVPLSSYAVLQLPPTILRGWAAFVQRLRMARGRPGGTAVTVSPTGVIRPIPSKKYSEGVEQAPKPSQALIKSFLDWKPGIDDRIDDAMDLDDSEIPF